MVKKFTLLEKEMTSRELLEFVKENPKYALLSDSDVAEFWKSDGMELIAKGIRYILYKYDHIYSSQYGCADNFTSLFKAKCVVKKSDGFMEFFENINSSKPIMDDLIEQCRLYCK